MEEFRASVVEELRNSTKRNPKGGVGVRETSVKTYKTKLNIMVKHDALGRYVDWIKSMNYPDSSKIGYNSAYLAFIKHSPTFREKYGDFKEDVINYQKQVTQQRQDDEKNGLLNKPPEKSLLDSDWDAMVKQASGQDHLMLMFYSKIPPLRSDFGRVRLVSDGQVTNEPNYLNVDTGELTIGEHKTSDTNPIQNVKLPETLMEDVRVSLRTDPRKWLFTLGNKPYNHKDTFSKHVRDTLFRFSGKKLGIHDLRHFFVTKFHEGSRSLKEQEEFASLSGHSVTMSHRYRRE